MNIGARTQAASGRPRRPLRHHHQPRPHRVALAAALALAAPLLQAQTAPAGGDATTVIVRGVRAAAETAQSIKRDSDQVIDSIVADDIGKFPDNNVAESLARVTGIQIRRDSGEANSVLIRGLPDVATLVNGREVFTTTGRYMALADVPAAMLSRVDVYKSQGSDLTEGGIAGVIDVRTRRPFDFSGAAVSLAARAVHNDKAKSTDPHISGVVSNRWSLGGGGEIGALLGVSSIRSRYHEERAFNTAPDTFTAADAATGNPVTVTGPFVMGLIPIKGERKRNAGNVALQWRPSASVELYAEGMTSRLDNRYELDFFVGLPRLGGNLTVTTIPGTQQIQTLTSTDTFTIMSTQANAQVSRTSQMALGGRWDLNSEWRGRFDVARTTSSFDWRNPIMDTNTWVPRVAVNTNVGGTPQFSYTGIDLTNPANFHVTALFDRYGRDKGDSNDMNLSMEYAPDDAGMLRSLSFGLRAVTRYAESNKSFEGRAGAPGDPFGTVPSTVPGLSCLSEPMAGGGPNYGLTRWFTPCASYLLDNTSAVRQLVTGSSAARPLDPGAYFAADEKAYAAFVKSNLSFKAAGMPLDVVAGLRLVHTEASVTGNTSQPDSSGALVYTPITQGSSYNDVLPSLNVKLGLAPDVLGRVALGRTVSRPGFAQLNPGVAYTAPSTTVVASAAGGNPNLRAVKADNLDVSLEWYFARASSVYATAFHRRFDGYIQGAVSQETFGGVTYNVTRPYNTQSGKLSGVELGYQQFYKGLPGALAGLGLQANLTFMQGSTATAGVTRDITGLSRIAYNLAGLYEYGPWSARLAYNVRGKFVDVYDQGGPGLDLTVAKTSSLDASISYKLNEELSLTVDGVNLLDTTYRDYWKDPAAYPRDTRRYDRSIGVGLRWRL